MEVTSPRADGILLTETLDELIGALHRRDYVVIGPTIRHQTLDWQPIRSARDLPVGWTALQAPGVFRAEKRDDDRRFGYATLAASLKRYVHSPEVRLLSTESPFHILPGEPDHAKVAVLGVRACDLAALQILDRVLLEDRYIDPHYAAHRSNLFLVAVNCSDPSDVCFCTSFNAGPRATHGYDIALTEINVAGAIAYCAESGSGAGTSLLEELGIEPAGSDAKSAAEEVCDSAASRIKRSVPRLPDRFDDAAWENVTNQCYGCGNCTQVCPTCFCITVDDSSDVRQHTAERVRKWDSCFTLGHSYIHGGSVRQSLKSRYRQWLTHKLLYWQDQFGTPGCVGCGRCITWCPAGIDITQVAASLAHGGNA